MKKLKIGSYEYKSYFTINVKAHVFFQSNCYDVYFKTEFAYFLHNNMGIIIF